MSGNHFITKFMFVFGLLMVILYLLLGFSLVFMNYFNYIPKEIKTIFGLFFVVYGLFRLVRIYYKYKDSKE